MSSSRMFGRERSSIESGYRYARESNQIQLRVLGEDPDTDPVAHTITDISHIIWLEAHTYDIHEE